MGEVTCGRSPQLSCKHDQIKMIDYMNRRVTQPKQVTSPTKGPPPPCKKAKSTILGQIVHVCNCKDDWMIKRVLLIIFYLNLFLTLSLPRGVSLKVPCNYKKRQLKGFYANLQFHLFLFIHIL